jgi:hypothetical protein
LHAGSVGWFAAHHQQLVGMVGLESAPGRRCPLKADLPLTHME